MTATRLHVAVTADPYFPVPPRFYGGIERVVDLLVRGLTARGHTVTLFAHPDSTTAGRLHPYGAPPHVDAWSRARELVQLGGGLWRTRRGVDVVHSFARLAALIPVLPLRLPKIQSYQREISWAGIRRAVQLAGETITFTACSSQMYAGAQRSGDAAGRWHTIYNGVDLSRYAAVSEVPADAPLVFLGRVERVKGPHHAIRIARAAGRSLILAGNLVTEGPDGDFYEREVAPHVDGHTVRYVGPVDDVQKNELLGGAAALLMPIEWEEPFGIVMAEALACGTPVIAYERGSVPEVVRHGVNGFVCRDAEQAAAAVSRLPQLDRAAIRRDCAARFGHDAIVEQYERLYFEVIGR